MTKPMRSPLLGYNHNIRHLGRVFHVQTEDSGPANPRLFTHLFFEGTILASRREQYEAAAPEDKVRALMKAQHKSLIRDLSHGNFDDRIVSFFEARGETISAGAMPLAPMPETPPPGSASFPGAAPVLATAPASELEPYGNDYPAAPAAAQNGEAQAVRRVAVDAAAASPAPVQVAAPLAAPVAPAAPIAPARAVMSGDNPQVVPPSAPAPPDGRVRTRRSVTLPVDTTRATAGAVTVRPPTVRRPPFVRSGSPVVARTTSADGVVVQRSVVVNGPPPMVKAARIRPPIPYVVGGGASPAQPTPSPRPAVTSASAPGPTTPGASPPPVAETAVPHAPLSAGPAVSAVSAVEAGHARSFGAVPDDKTLDEVILEYLSEPDEENGAG